MNASTHSHITPTGKPAQNASTRLATSVFKGEARLRELEHLADTARKIRDQAAAELTRGVGSTHHIARERIAVAERMLRKTQLEMTELRQQLAKPHSAASVTADTNPSKDMELAILLGHNRGRFSQVGGEHEPLELLQDVRVSRQRSSATPATRGSRAGKQLRKSRRTLGLLLAVGLIIAALGGLGTLNRGVVDTVVQSAWKSIH